MFINLMGQHEKINACSLKIPKIETKYLWKSYKAKMSFWKFPLNFKN